jgi:hypothetical protein
MNTMNRIKKNRDAKKRAVLFDQCMYVACMIGAVAFMVICTYGSL